MGTQNGNAEERTDSKCDGQRSKIEKQAFRCMRREIYRSKYLTGPLREPQMRLDTHQGFSIGNFEWIEDKTETSNIGSERKSVKPDAKGTRSKSGW